jgi:hypothetical protein
MISSGRNAQVRKTHAAGILSQFKCKNDQFANSRKKAIFVFYLQDVVEVLEGLIVSAHGGNIPVQLPLPRAAAAAAAAAEAEDAVAEVAARL